MDNNFDKAFKLIKNKISETLSAMNFNETSSTYAIEGNNSCVFIGESVAYALTYDKEKKLFNLYKCSVENKKADENWNTVSSWLFDPDEHTSKDATSIAEDFIETLSCSSKVSTAKKTKKRKSDSNTIDPIFLMNRFVNIWPQLKNDISYEKENYESFRAVTFTKEKVLPLLFALLVENNKSKIKKLASILSDMYKVGDLDTRGLITIVILNSIDDKYIPELETELSTELQKAWKFARKIKGKKIKAEKPKKQKNNIWAQTLKESSEIRR